MVGHVTRCVAILAAAWLNSTFHRWPLVSGNYGEEAFS